MAEASPPPIPRPRRWLRIALVLSLGVNLAVAGLVAGLAFNGRPPHGPGGEIGLWRYGAALPAPYRHDLGRELRASRGDWAGPRDSLRGQRRALAEVLTAEPYDPDAAARVLGAERELLTALADRGTTLLLGQIARMDAAERRLYAEALLRGRGGPPRRRP